MAYDSRDYNIISHLITAHSDTFKAIPPGTCDFKQVLKFSYSEFEVVEKERSDEDNHD
jgi:hypothetical protein